MRQGILLAFLLFGVLIDSYANNDKYRLIIVDDPSTTITVAWNQISGTNPTVYYDVVDHGTNHTQYAFSKGVDRARSSRGMSNQFARLSGLIPNTNYYFVIHDSQGSSERFWFRTAPSDNSRLFFIAGGDSRNNRTPRRNANKLVSKLKPHAVYFGGDMTDDDTNSEWQNWFDDWQLTTADDGRMFPIVPARGNHESSTSVYNLFDTPTSNSYYAITWGNNLIRTYTLNSEISVLGDQLTWLQNDLAASANMVWKMAQYHKPMRPHTSGKSEGNSEYDAWAQLFYDNKVRLVVDCDSHMSKTTWPVKPSSGQGNDEGFVLDELNGTVYTGEGCWGAPLRPNNDDKSWTRNSGSFNQFKLIFIDEEEIELRTVIVNNADDVEEGSNDDPFDLPDNLDVFSPPSGSIVRISNGGNGPCALIGTPCDDGNNETVFDEEDGFCNCEGLLNVELNEEAVNVIASEDDAEEFLATGEVDLTSGDLELIYDRGEQLVGIRFDRVQIPEGATLYRSYIQFQTDEDDSDQDPTNLVIHGELSPSSASFQEVLGNISSRSLTNNSVQWNEIQLWENVGEADLKQRTPYLNDLVQEILDQPGWQQGNAMTFIISGSGKRVAESFNGTAAPVLKLFYQSPCAPAGTICDDGDPNTESDEEDGFCNCRGINPTTYCTASGNTEYVTGISYVSFNTLQNTDTDNENSPYEDFTNLSTTVQRNQSYELTVRLNTAGDYTIYAMVWIDWNADGDFADNNESYQLGSATDSPDGITSFSPLAIMVPSNADIGSTRMRIAAKWDEYPSSCENGFDGEVEDYTVKIADPVDDCNFDIATLDYSQTTQAFRNGDCDEDGVTNGNEIDPDGDGIAGGTGPNGPATDALDPCDYNSGDITLPVTADQSGCPCVELTPVLTAVPSNIQGISNLNVTIRIVELSSVDTDGSDITVRIPVDDRLSLSYDPSLTRLGFTDVQNSEWIYLGSNGLFHQFRRSGILSGGTSSTLGIEATYDPQSTEGTTTMTATIIPGSGGECQFDNNADAEIIKYFD